MSNEQAFPRIESVTLEDQSGDKVHAEVQSQPGLTKLELVAAIFAAGYLVGGHLMPARERISQAWVDAEAFLEESEKRKAPPA